MLFVSSIVSNNMAITDGQNKLHIESSLRRERETLSDTETLKKNIVRLGC